MEDKKKNKKSFLIGILIFAFYFIASFYQDIPLKLLNINYQEWSNMAIIIYSLIYELLLILIVIFAYRKELIKQFIDYKNHIKGYLKVYIKYWFLALGLMYVSNLIILMFTSDIAQNEAQVRSLLDSFPLYTFIVTVIFAPVIEELIFRYSIRKICFQIKWLFIILSGLVFGAMHVFGNVTVWTDVLFIIPYSIPGWVFAYTLDKSDNIFVPISLHTIHNGILISLQLLVTVR